MCVCVSSTSLFGQEKGTAIGIIWSKAVCLCVWVCVRAQIFLVHYMEVPADSVSSNVSDLEENCYLLLCTLFPPASNYTLLYYDRSIRESVRM